jgi:hypothetical protein
MLTVRHVAGHEHQTHELASGFVLRHYLILCMLKMTDGTSGALPVADV